MNHSNDYTLALGPCADHEFDLVELADGSLEPGRALRLRQHMEHCARCSNYAAAIGRLDASLAAGLQRPQLSPGFDARLQARIAELQRVPDRAAAIAAAEREHEEMLRTLRRALNWRTVLNAAALGSVVGGTLVGLESFAPGLLESLGLVRPGSNATATFFTTLAAVFAAYGLYFARRPASAPTLLAG